MRKGKLKYLEPPEYFPITIRKKHKLGEFAEKDDATIEWCGGI